MDKQKFTKKALSITQQIQLLKERGLIITDETSARLCLESVSFHRLSAYFPPYESDSKKHIFNNSATFQHIWNLYVFDRELRLRVLDVIERIEIALRTALSNELATRHHPWWYMEDALFKTSWVSTAYKKNYTPKALFFYELDAVCSDQKHNTEVKHYYDKYNHPPYPPCWIILEFLSFGKCTSLFRQLRSHQDKAAVSQIFGMHPNIFESTLEPLRYTRNLCAHHSRLWDRWFVYKPRNLIELKKINCRPGTLKEQIGLLNLFLKKISPQSSWKEHLYDLFACYEPFIKFELMGFHKPWNTDPFWEA